jgi:phosphatidylserine/phosphatidylglycerophosphate/cardiolipin synthase-like enzyme
MPNDCSVEGTVAAAPFTLRVHRGEGMALVAMNWRNGRPPDDFVGFAIEYQEPGDDKFFAVKNRLTFEGSAPAAQSPAARPPKFSSLASPIQKFRWVHFPFHPDLPGLFTYRVTPISMNEEGELSQGVAQLASLELASETYPGKLNVAFTRGFVSSQAFVDRYISQGPISTLLPASSKDGLTFQPTHPAAQEAYKWMGFEAHAELLATLDAAIADKGSKVGIVAFDFDLPEIVDRVITLGKDRVRVIIDDSKDHHGNGAAEDAAEQKLAAAGIPVKRQHMRSLQHNKTIYVDGPTVQRVVCGSTNMSWRGLFVQSNNAVVIQGATAVGVFKAAFEEYWANPGGFPSSLSAGWNALGLDDIDVKIAFSPHGKVNSVLEGIGSDIAGAKSSILYSLAFLAITPGVIREALATQTNNKDLFVAGISDKRTGIEVTSSSSNLPPTFVQPLDKNVPPPFKAEPSGLSGGGNVGTRMHHKFIVIDFNTPDARVYLGSYNMSKAADGSNGENLVLVRDRRVATAYMVEALSMIDHYQFRVAQTDALKRKQILQLQRPPKPGEQPWWAEDWSDPQKIRDRILFS